MRRRIKGRRIKGMCGDPVSRDFDATADPHALMAADVIEKALQRCDPAGSAAEPRVQPNGQHLGLVEPRGIALSIQRIEGILQVIEELRARIESLHGGKAHVVAVERVGHDEMRLGQ